MHCRRVSRKVGREFPSLLLLSSLSPPSLSLLIIYHLRGPGTAPCGHRLTDSSQAPSETGVAIVSILQMGKPRHRRSNKDLEHGRS